uniref:Uncharacterized protein n=1 Tax=Anguilla anguilla TaxID=7936 RepID=A0A0E9VYK7_ANGAN
MDGWMDEWMDGWMDDWTVLLHNALIRRGFFLTTEILRRLMRCVT